MDQKHSTVQERAGIMNNILTRPHDSSLHHYCEGGANIPAFSQQLNVFDKSGQISSSSLILFLKMTKKSTLVFKWQAFETGHRPSKLWFKEDSLYSICYQLWISTKKLKTKWLIFCTKQNFSMSLMISWKSYFEILTKEEVISKVNLDTFYGPPRNTTECLPVISNHYIGGHLGF